MTAIRDYGRGHGGLLSPGSDAKPDEDYDAYKERITALLAKEDFAQLEKMGQQNRTKKGRLLGGAWKTYAFYDGMTSPGAAGEQNRTGFEQQIARVKKWVAAYPNSATAHVALAQLYLNYAAFVRGTGVADTVSDSQWDVLNDRTAQAKATLLEASKLPEKDPGWYTAMQDIAMYEGWDKPRMRELFDQATAFEPDYYHYYRQYANYLLPQWYGEPGDVQAFAEEVARRVPDPNGSMLYFQIVSTLSCYCQEGIQALVQTSYPKLRLGYSNITQFFGASNLTANRFAFMATTFRDQASAREAFAAISSIEPEIWGSEQVFDSAKQWANLQ